MTDDRQNPATSSNLITTKDRGLPVYRNNPSVPTTSGPAHPHQANQRARR